MTREYNDEFQQQEYLKLLTKCIKKNNKIDCAAIKAIQDNGIIAADAVINDFQKQFPFLLAPENFFIFEKIRDKFTGRFEKIRGKESLEFKKAEAYLSVFLSEYERVLEDYSKDKNQKSYIKLIRIKKKFDNLSKNIDINLIHNLEDIKINFEADRENILNFRRARTSFFEPAFTTFEKNLRINYFKKLIKLVITDPMPAVRWFPIDRWLSKIYNQDAGIAISKDELNQSMQTLILLTRRLENETSGITTYESLMQALGITYKNNDEENESASWTTAALDKVAELVLF